MFYSRRVIFGRNVRRHTPVNLGHHPSGMHAGRGQLSRGCVEDPYSRYLVTTWMSAVNKSKGPNPLLFVGIVSCITVYLKVFMCSFSFQLAISFGAYSLIVHRRAQAQAASKKPRQSDNPLVSLPHKQQDQQ